MLVHSLFDQGSIRRSGQHETLAWDRTRPMKDISNSNVITDLRGDAALRSRAVAARAADTPASAAAVPPPGSQPPAELRALDPGQPAAPPGAPAAAELLSADNIGNH